MKSSPSSKPDASDPNLQVRTYLAALPADARGHVEKLRAAIRAAAPGAVESFGYGMPAFALTQPVLSENSFQAAAEPRARRSQRSSRRRICRPTAALSARRLSSRSG